MKAKLAGAFEVAEALGVTTQRVHQLAREPGFPTPLARLHAGAIWNLDDVHRWKDRTRPMSTLAPQVPPRDPDRPTDDPYDADAVRYLMMRTGLSRNHLMEHLRGQKRLDQAKVAAVRAIAAQHGVSCGPHPDGKTVHIFRSDTGAPLPYPASEAERRSWLAAERDKSENN